MFARFDVLGQPAFVIINTDGSTQQVFGAVDAELLNSILADVTAA